MTSAATLTETGFRAALLTPSQNAPEGLTDGAGRPAGRRFDVYRNNVAVSLREALESGFPAVAKLIGPENFSRAAGMFLRQSPPVSPLMMHYGAGFAEFLEGVEALRPIGYLGDVARLELALRRSYHAADAPALDGARLATLSEEALSGARFTLAPATQVLCSAWPVVSIYRFTLIAGCPKPQAQAEDVLICRPAFDPEPHVLPPGGTRFVAALDKGARFAEAMQAAGPEFDLSATLTLLLSQGALTDMTTD